MFQLMSWFYFPFILPKVHAFLFTWETNKGNFFTFKWFEFLERQYFKIREGIFISIKIFFCGCSTNEESQIGFLPICRISLIKRRKNIILNDFHATFFMIWKHVTNNKRSSFRCLFYISNFGILFYFLILVYHSKGMTTCESNIEFDIFIVVNFINKSTCCVHDYRFIFDYEDRSDFSYKQ